MVTKARNFEMEWAKIHLDALHTRYSAFVSKPENSYRVTQYEDTERGFLIIKGESINDIEVVAIGLTAGDFVCNLRSSLEHLAWALAKIGKRRPSSETCFPVCTKDGASTQAYIAAATAGMPSGAISAMKSFQPYSYGHAYKTHPLWRLNFLWNVNKHRTIGLNSINSGTLLEIAHDVTVIEEPEVNGHKVVSIPLSAKDKVRLNPRPNVEIFFGDEERGIKFTIQDLRDIYEFVRLEVSPALSCFLP